MAIDAGARARLLSASLLLAACSSPSPPPKNVATAPASLAIAPDQPLGWIGIAPRATNDAADWIPAGTQSVLVPMPAEGLAAGAALTAVDRSGRSARVTAGAATKVPYGCENHRLDALAFTGERFAPGAVWLLSPAAPASWRPRSLAIASPVSASATRRRDTVGPLALELARSDASHGTLTISRDGRAIHTAAIDRPAMDGADLAPLDLQAPGVAIPQPVAAWSIGDGGPILLVLEVPSFEGIHLNALLIESDRARELPTMAAYLYQCAF